MNAKFQKLDEIYARIPRVKCRGLCQSACGPIVMTEGEAARVREATGKPFGRCGHDLTCPQLGTDGRCEVYELRPVICRVWGVTAAPEMECPHDCEIEEGKPRLSVEDTLVIFLLAEMIGGKMNRSTHPVDFYETTRKMFGETIARRLSVVTNMESLGR